MKFKEVWAEPSHAPVPKWAWQEEVEVEEAGDAVYVTFPCGCTLAYTHRKRPYWAPLSTITDVYEWVKGCALDDPEAIEAGRCCICSRPQDRLVFLLNQFFAKKIGFSEVRRLYRALIEACFED